ncbi:MAG: glyoxalase [Lachnospiraceae bacterium]|nr:glyoxalase [Lachnospiraceae bacterium]
MTEVFDDEVLDVFLRDQGRLFSEEVAADREEARDFLTDCMAVVVDSAEEALEYFDEAGMDVEEEDAGSILDADEVFDIGDGRYLIVNG